jgi:hypothetical protein
MILGFRPTLTAQCVELDFFESGWLPRPSNTMAGDPDPTTISSTTAESPVDHAGSGAKDIAVEFFTLSEELQQPVGDGFMVGNITGQRPGADHSYHDYGTFTPLWYGHCCAGRRSAMRTDIVEQYRQRRNLY